MPPYLWRALYLLVALTCKANLMASDSPSDATCEGLACGGTAAEQLEADEAGLLQLRGAQQVDIRAHAQGRTVGIPKSQQPALHEAPAEAKEVHVDFSASGQHAHVYFRDGGVDRHYTLEAMSVYKAGVTPKEHTKDGKAPLREPAVATFRSRKKLGYWASAILGQDKSVSGLFEAGDHVIVIRPPKEDENLPADLDLSGPRAHAARRVPHAVLLQAARKRVSGLSKEAVVDEPINHTFVADPPLVDWYVNASRSRGRTRAARDVGSAQTWNGVRWFPNCYEGDTKLHDFEIGLYVDTAGWNAWQQNTRPYVEQVMLESSFIYEQQLNIRLIVGEFVIYKEEWNAPVFAKDCSVDSRDDALVKKLDDMSATVRQFPFMASFMLFTGCRNSAYGGYAWIGTICSQAGWNTAVSNLWGGSGYRSYIFMHELGHNFGGYHSFEDGKGTTGGIMDYGDGTLDGTTQFNTQYRKTQMCSMMNSAVQSCQVKFAPATGTDPEDMPEYVYLQSWHGTYVTATPSTGALSTQAKLSARAIEVYGDRQKFKVVKTGSYYAFQSYEKMYVAAERGTGVLVANRPALDDWEKFELVEWGGSEELSIKTWHSKFWCSEPSGRLVADREWMQDWEKFLIIPADGSTVNPPTTQGYCCWGSSGNCGDKGSCSKTGDFCSKSWDQCMGPCGGVMFCPE